MYKLTKYKYNHLLDNAVTATCKRATEGIKDIINRGGMKYPKRFNILDRIELNSTRNCFIILKDKENFANHPTTRLINPSKNESGKIGKAILDKIKICLFEKLKLIKLKNKTDVINWFNKIDKKHLQDFYPSIKETLLKNAIQFSAEHTNINKNGFEVTFHAQKPLLLFHSNQPWIERDSKTFDVTMGVYDGNEICELVGIFMLSLSKTYSSNNIDLYCDDGLSVFRNTCGTHAEKHKKIIPKFSKTKASK